MPNAKPMTIGVLAQETGTKVVTIRYYEQIRLLPPPRRTAGNYRVYDEAHLRRLRFIRRGRALGFTLEQVRELVELAVHRDWDCAQADRIAMQHLAAIEEKIADLRLLAAELRGLGPRCDRSEEHTSELQSLMRISYAVFCLTKQNN